VRATISPTAPSKTDGGRRRSGHLLTEGDRGENRMFGLPTTTTLIMVGILGFWVVYTIAFYVMTSNWSVEDTDSDHTEVVS
jgi:hypothetical protein